jgi:hypothetical protein
MTGRAPGRRPCHSAPGRRVMSLYRGCACGSIRRPLRGSRCPRRRARRGRRRCRRRAIPMPSRWHRGSAPSAGTRLACWRHVATWPMTVLVDCYHPARRELPKLACQPPSIRPGDDPPRSVRHRPRAPRGGAERAQRPAHVVAPCVALIGACRKRYPRIPGSRGCAGGSTRLYRQTPFGGPKRPWPHASPCAAARIPRLAGPMRA